MGMGATLGLLAAGTALATVSSIGQGQAAAAAGKASAAAAEQEGEQAMRAAGVEHERRTMELRRLLARQTAAIGVSGLGGGGTFQGLRADTAEAAVLDALRARYGGLLASASAKQRAEIYKVEGKGRKTAGYLGAGSTLAYGGERGLEYGSRLAKE